VPAFGATKTMLCGRCGRAGSARVLTSEMADLLRRYGVSLTAASFSHWHALVEGRLRSVGGET